MGKGLESSGAKAVASAQNPFAALADPKALAAQGTASADNPFAGLANANKELPQASLASSDNPFAALANANKELPQAATAGSKNPFAALAAASKGAAQAGALALGLSGGALPAMADDAKPAFDNRAPLTASRAPAAPQAAAASITINVYGSPGMDTNALAQAVATEVAKQQRAGQARVRSSLFDHE